MKKSAILLLAALLGHSTLGAAEIVIDDFESAKSNWIVKGQGLRLEPTDDPSEVKEGKAAGRLSIDYDQPFSSNVKCDLPDLTGVSASSGVLTFWLLGDGSGAKVQISFIAQDGGVFSVEKAVDWSGWEEVSIPLSQITFNQFAGADQSVSTTLDPSRLKSFTIGVYGALKAGEAKHQFVIDSIRLLP